MRVITTRYKNSLPSQKYNLIRYNKIVSRSVIKIHKDKNKKSKLIDLNPLTVVAQCSREVII